MAEKLPPTVVRFVTECIHSVEQLEVLLLVRTRTSPPWTAEEVSRELRTTPDAATSRLEDLTARKLLHVAPGTSPKQYDFAPSDADTRTAIDLLAALYPARRYSIIELIFSRPVDPIRAFADAFRLRKDGGNDDR